MPDNHQPSKSRATNVIQLPNKQLFAAVYAELQNGHTVTIRAKGNSMRPFIESERDLVKLQAVEPDSLCKGDVVLAETTDHRIVLHRIVAMDAETFTLRGDGNLRFTETCLRSEVKAKAVAFYRKGSTRPDTTDSRKWRIYSAVWTRLLPLRRYLLAFYRLVWLRIFPVR